jgi:hypothetical protein
MDGKSVRLSAMNQAPSTQEETKNCSTSNCGLPNIPYFQKSRNLYVQKQNLESSGIPVTQLAAQHSEKDIMCLSLNP